MINSGKLSGGDRVFLMDGYHGPLKLTGQNFSSPVLFTPVPGQTAHVDLINLTKSSNLVFNGLKVWPTSSAPGKSPLVRTYMGTSNIAFTNLDVRGEATSGNYMSWPVSMWRANKRAGFQVDGDQISIVGNRLTGVQMGILTLGTNALVEKNIIDGFSGDGMRALGDNSIVRGNKVQNCVKIDANHDDGFQSFSRSASGKSGQGVVKNLTLEDNKIFEWASSTNNPLRCKLQGIGMFDGMYDGVTIRNNVISVSAYHGISIAGALNTVITNNTVINARSNAANYPWIKINAHKNGTPPKNVLVANNLVTSMKVFNNANNNVVEVSNMVVKNPSAEFTSPATLDFTLKPTAKAANSANPKYAPPFDIMGVARPRGNAPDMGAYESQ